MPRRSFVGGAMALLVLLSALMAPSHSGSAAPIGGDGVEEPTGRGFATTTCVVRSTPSECASRIGLFSGVEFGLSYPCFMNLKDGGIGSETGSCTIRTRSGMTGALSSDGCDSFRLSDPAPEGELIGPDGSSWALEEIVLVAVDHRSATVVDAAFEDRWTLVPWSPDSGGHGSYVLGVQDGEQLIMSLAGLLRSNQGCSAGHVSSFDLEFTGEGAVIPA